MSTDGQQWSMTRTWLKTWSGRSHKGLFSKDETCRAMSWPLARKAQNWEWFYNTLTPSVMMTDYVHRQWAVGKVRHQLSGEPGHLQRCQVLLPSVGQHLHLHAGYLQIHHPSHPPLLETRGHRGNRAPLTHGHVAWWTGIGLTFCCLSSTGGVSSPGPSKFQLFVS